MRELKFRAWDNGLKRYLTEEDGLELHLDGSYVIFFEGGWYAPDITLEQYTGLHDCNDKEIYEGDILRWISSTGRELRYAVKWDTSAWCWTAGGYMLSAIIEQDCQVIGNIHENEDLL